ncbi:MAG: hypothetical protein E7007_02050 [Alphaproteobacteria bacterium]|nr:hypothetical protein [Alphaproteobacteria bacterium]
MKTNKKNVRVEHSTSQRIWGALALAGLFVCGLMVGWGLNQGHANKVAQPKVATNPAPVAEPQQKETCAIIEDLLLERLNPVDSQDVRDHEYNIDIYEKLVMNGCSENQQKYHNAAVREREIVAALQASNNSQQTCEQIESLLIGRLPSASDSAYDRIDRAKIYANLSERGCAENSAKYVEMAKQELEIARALEDDVFDNQETIEVVETYKRLNMQAAAEEIFETAKKLTNPAIDFILEVEKIINEQ